MKTVFKIFLVLIVFLILGLGYTGIVPGVSHIMGTNKPIDLGVIISDEAAKSGDIKVGLMRENLPSDTLISQSIEYEGSHPAQIEMNEEEIVSLYKGGGFEFNSWAKDLQVKINDDGKIELSTLIKIDNFEKYIEATNLVDIKKAKEYLGKMGIVGNELPIYAVGTASITDNKMTLNVESAKLGRAPLPVVKDGSRVASELITKRINSIPGFNIKSVTFENGKLKFDGTIPDKIKTLVQ